MRKRRNSSLYWSHTKYPIQLEKNNSHRTKKNHSREPKILISSESVLSPERSKTSFRTLHSGFFFWIWKRNYLPWFLILDFKYNKKKYFENNFCLIKIHFYGFSRKILLRWTIGGIIPPVILYSPWSKKMSRVKFKYSLQLHNFQKKLQEIDKIFILKFNFIYFNYWDAWLTGDIFYSFIYWWKVHK